MSEHVPTDLDAVKPGGDTAFAPPRALDHLVLPVSSIARARERYRRLGFTVAPAGTHSFGTENCCIYLANDTFLEPLAVRRREDAEAAALAGNTFVRHDAAYRFRRGIEGFSHLVVKCDSAESDHADYQEAGISAGPIVRFSRGEPPKRASFALAFAGDLRAPDAGFFSCEIVETPERDLMALLTHENGATAISEVVMCEPNPTDFQYFLQEVFDQRRMDDHSFGIEFELANARVSVLTPTGLRAFCGLESDDPGRGLLHRTFVVEVSSLADTDALLAANGVETRKVGHRLLVPWAAGQGTAMLFEERP